MKGNEKTGQIGLTTLTNRDKLSALAYTNINQDRKEAKDHGHCGIQKCIPDIP